MFKLLTNIAQNAAAYLQNGVAPPGVCPKENEELAQKNHFSSKKFFATFSGFIILACFYILNIGILFLLANDPALLAVYPTIFTKTVEVFAAIMAVYLGGQAIVDVKYNSSSSASFEAKTEVVDITERKITNEKEGDYTLEIEDETK
jgi:hypothetical protein